MVASCNTQDLRVVAFFKKWNLLNFRNHKMGFKNNKKKLIREGLNLGPVRLRQSYKSRYFSRATRSVRTNLQLHSRTWTPLPFHLSITPCLLCCFVAYTLETIGMP